MSVIKKLARAMIALTVLFSVFIDGSLFSVSALSVSADSAILIDGKSGAILYSKNAQRVRPMASTTKIMTALLAIESGNLDRSVTVTRESVGVEGSSIYLTEGEELTLRQLLYALLLSSANDAATAIAIEIGGSVEDFAEMMNKKAAQLGLSSTHFDNPHGLDSGSHYTTANDLALLAAHAMSIPEFRSIVSCYKTTIPMQGAPNGRLIVNHNKLLRSYPGAVGIKTGFTKKSGRCLVSAAERDGALLIAVTLAAPNDWQDHRAMLDYGFENYVSVPLTDGGISFEIPVVSGESASVSCKLKDETDVLLRKDHGSIVCRIEADRFLYAPVARGESVGSVTFICDGRELAASEILTLDEVRLSRKPLSLWDKIKLFFGIN